MKSSMLCALIGVLAMPGLATVQPASVFNHNMVLQQGCRVPVWGTAAAGEKVSVAYGGARKSCVAGSDGQWRLELEPMMASAAPQDLTIGSCFFTNVVVGEVWLCSGQSNMELSLWGSPQIGLHAGRETDGYFDAALVDLPEVRACTVPREWDIKERTDFQKKLSWKPFLPGTQRALSAIAFHYAVILHASLRVPVGVIVAAWGGSSIKPWISPDGFRSVPSLAKFADVKLVKSLDGKLAANEADAKNSMVLRPARNNVNPSQCRILWNAMIRPLVPFAFRGAIWYQGETDCGMRLGYYDHLEALWNGWSEAFERPEMSFYLVQIAPYKGYCQWVGQRHCEIWTAQEKFARDHAYAGMASTVDVGELDNLHPCHKRTVAMRLAALALNRDYGRKDIRCDGPALSSCRAQGNVVLLSFDHVSNWCRCGGEQPSEFEIAGTNGVFKAAIAEYGKGTIKVASEEVKTPKAVRYLWNWNLVGKLKNECGLPVPPFCVDVQEDSK